MTPPTGLCRTAREKETSSREVSSSSIAPRKNVKDADAEFRWKVSQLQFRQVNGLQKDSTDDGYINPNFLMSNVFSSR